MSALQVALDSCVPLSPLPPQPARCRPDIRQTEGNSDVGDELLAIEEACHAKWAHDVVAAEVQDDQSTAISHIGTASSSYRAVRMSKHMLMNDQQVWKKRIIPASRLPELLSQQQEQNQNRKSHKAGATASNVQARERWSRAVASVSESEGVDRTMTRVRNISKRVRSAMFYEDSGYSVLKLQNMLAGYHRSYEHKRYGRLTSLFDDVPRLAQPIDSMIESRTYEIYEVMQLELSLSLQNELARRADPMELARVHREADNIMEQCQVSKKNMDNMFEVLQASVAKASSEASSFLDLARKELQALSDDIADFTAQHNHLRKADIDYQADLFDQQRRNDALVDQLEKLTARRRLAETRMQADMESLRTENTVIKRSVGALSKLYEDNKNRCTEISNWVQVLCGRHLERNHEVMLRAYKQRVVRRQAFYERIAWLQLQHLRAVVDKLSERLLEAFRDLKEAKTRQEVRLYRRLTAEARCLMCELQLRAGELQKDGCVAQRKAIEKSLMKGKKKSNGTGLLLLLAEELGVHAAWMRSRSMDVSISTDTLKLSGTPVLCTPLSLLQCGQFLMRQRELALYVIREMRRASNPLESKVMDITSRFKQKLLEKRYDQAGQVGQVDGFDDVSSAEEEEEEAVLEHSQTMDPVDPDAIKVILQKEHQSLLEVQAQATTDERGVEEASSPEDTAKALEELLELAKAQDGLQQSSTQLLLRLSALPGCQEVAAFFADLLEDFTAGLRIGYMGAGCLSDPANPRATPWKLNARQLPWLSSHASACAKRSGALRAAAAILEGALPTVLSKTPRANASKAALDTSEEVGAVQVLGESVAAVDAATVAAVADFLVALPPLATVEMMKVSEECMTRVEKGLKRHLHLQQAAHEACAQFQSSPGINLTSTEGKAEALPLGPPPHSFVTSSKGLQLLMDSKDLADTDAFAKLTEAEILDVLLTAATREYQLAMPDCFRAAVLAIADLGGLFEDHSRTETPMLPPEAVAARSSPYQEGLWRYLAARRGPGVAGMCSPSEATGELSATDPFHLDGFRRLPSRERAGTATDSSRPWTSTPRRPSTEDSTRLPSRQTGMGVGEPAEFESSLLQLTQKLQPSLDEEEGSPSAHDAAEVEELRLETARQEQEAEVEQLEHESEELANRLQSLRDRISRIADESGSSEAWRLGELMAEASQAESLQTATQKTLAHRLHVAKLVKDQQLRQKKKRDLMKEYKKLAQQEADSHEGSEVGRVLSNTAALSEKEFGRMISDGSAGRFSRQQSLQQNFARQLTGSDRIEKDLHVRSRLAEIEEALAKLNFDIEEGEAEEMNVVAEVESLEHERASVLEPAASLRPVKAEQTEEELVASYCTRVAQRSLWKVVLQKHKKAKLAAKGYVASLLVRITLPPAFVPEAPEPANVPAESASARSLRSLRSQKSLRTVVSEGGSSSRPSRPGTRSGSKKRPTSKPRSQQAGRGGAESRRASSKPSSAASSPRVAAPKKHATRIVPGPNAKAAAVTKGAMFVGEGASGSSRNQRRTLTVSGPPPRKASSSSSAGGVQGHASARPSIESRRRSSEVIEGLDEVMMVHSTSARPVNSQNPNVPVISVRPPSSSSRSSSGWSTTSSEIEKEEVSPAPTPEPPATGPRRPNVMTGLLETKALRQEVQLSLGEQEIQKTNKWLDNWINGTADDDFEAGMPPEKSRSRRIGMQLSDWSKDISPLLASAALGLDLGQSPGHASDTEAPERSPSERSQASDRPPKSRSLTRAEAKEAREARDALGQSVAGRTVRLMSTSSPENALMLFATQVHQGNRRRLIPSPGDAKKKGAKKGQKGAKKRKPMSSSDGTDTDREALHGARGFLADPTVSKLQDQFLDTSRGSVHKTSRRSSRREHSTSTTLPSGAADGLQEDSLMTLTSSVHSTDRYHYLSQNAIARAVAEQGSGNSRWKIPKGPLPKLVDVRKNGPGDVEAAKRAEKGHKASVSAAMVQAARMQPKRLRAPSKPATEKPLSQAESRVSLAETKAVHFSQDPVELSQDYEILSAERSGSDDSPARSSRSGRSSRGARSMSRPSSAGWSLAESETGAVLSTFPKKCKPPSLSARSKRLFGSL